MDEFTDFEMPSEDKPTPPKKPRPKPTRRRVVKKKAVVKARKPRVVTANSRLGLMLRAYTQIGPMLQPLTPEERQGVLRELMNGA